MHMWDACHDQPLRSPLCVHPATAFSQFNLTQIHPSAATILPCGTRTLTVFFAWGLKHMLAGMVLISAVVGLVAMVTAFALSAPTWLALAIYPVLCSLTLLCTAAISSIRAPQPSQTVTLLRSQA
jgi:hypothetical protein